MLSLSTAKVVVKAGLCRGNGLSRSTQSLSPCQSRTSQVDGCLSRLLLVLQALSPEFHGCSSGRAKRACKSSLCGYGDLSHVEMRWNSPLGLLLPEGMAHGHAKMEKSCLVLHDLLACTLVELRRFVAASLRGGRAVLPGYSVLGGLITFEIWTHLSLYFCVVSVRVWGLLKVRLSTDSSPRKRCMLARHLSLAHTVQVSPHVSQNTSGVCIAPVSKMQANPGFEFSRADYGAFVSFH